MGTGAVANALQPCKALLLRIHGHAWSLAGSPVASRTHSLLVLHELLSVHDRTDNVTSRRSERARQSKALSAPRAMSDASAPAAAPVRPHSGDIMMQRLPKIMLLGSDGGPQQATTAMLIIDIRKYLRCFK